jgi:hypothetical protein
MLTTLTIALFGDALILSRPSDPPIVTVPLGSARRPPFNLTGCAAAAQNAVSPGSWVQACDEAGENKGPQTGEDADALSLPHRPLLALSLGMMMHFFSRHPAIRASDPVRNAPCLASPSSPKERGSVHNNDRLLVCYFPFRDSRIALAGAAYAVRTGPDSRCASARVCWFLIVGLARAVRSPVGTRRSQSRRRGSRSTDVGPHVRPPRRSMSFRCRRRHRRSSSLRHPALLAPPRRHCPVLVVRIRETLFCPADGTRLARAASVCLHS